MTENNSNAETQPSLFLTRLRIFLGELILVVDLFMFFILIYQIYLYIFVIDRFSQVSFIRNVIIVVLLTVLGALLAYGQVIPFRNRKFLRNFSDNAKVDLFSKTSRLLLKIFAILMLIFSFILGIAILSTWEQGDIIMLFEAEIPFIIPSLIFGIRWYQSGKRIDRFLKAQGVIDDERKDLVPSEELKQFQKDPESKNFHVIKPRLSTWIILIVIFVISSFFYLSGGLGDFYFRIVLYSIVISLLAWRFIPELVMKIFDYFVLAPVSKSQGDENQSVGFLRKQVLKLIGIEVTGTGLFYLEEYPDDFDFNDISKVLLDRVLFMITTCFAVLFVLLNSLSNPSIIGFIEYGKLWYPGLEDHVVVLAVLLLSITFSPLLVSWLVPVLWIIKDMDLRSIGHGNNIQKVATKMETSTLEKILGYGGVLSALLFILRLFTLYPQFSFTLGNRPNQGTIFWDAGARLFTLSLTFIGPAFVITCIYLLFLHEGMVNKFRDQLQAKLGTYTTIVRQLEPSEREIVETEIQSR